MCKSEAKAAQIKDEKRFLLALLVADAAVEWRREAVASRRSGHTYKLIKREEELESLTEQYEAFVAALYFGDDAEEASDNLP